MDIKAYIAELLEKKFEEDDFSDYFLIRTKSGPQRIQVFIDGDRGISLGVCTKISRYLEPYLDQLENLRDDYILEVSSPGIKEPLAYLRQYPQHLGRNLEILTKSGDRIKAKLVDILGDELILEKKYIEKQGKKKLKKTKKLVMKFNEVEKTFVKASI